MTDEESESTVMALVSGAPNPGTSRNEAHRRSVLRQLAAMMDLAAMRNRGQ